MPPERPKSAKISNRTRVNAGAAAASLDLEIEDEDEDGDDGVVDDGCLEEDFDEIEFYDDNGERIDDDDDGGGGERRDRVCVIGREEANDRGSSSSYVDASDDLLNVNSKGVDDLFSDILYSNGGELTVKEDELHLLRSPSPIITTQQEGDNEDDDFIYEPAKSDRRFPVFAPGGRQGDPLIPAFSGQPTQETALERTQLRLIRRTAEAEIRVLRRPQALSLAYPELQRASGLRVLRRVIERKRGLEATKAESFGSSTSSSASSSLDLNLMKRPPTKLKPLSMFNQHQEDHKMNN